jgi:hypothetical protein
LDPNPNRESDAEFIFNALKENLGTILYKGLYNKIKWIIYDIIDNTYRLAYRKGYHDALIEIANKSQKTNHEYISKLMQ